MGEMHILEINFVIDKNVESKWNRVWQKLNRLELIEQSKEEQVPVSKLYKNEHRV
jgi:hypothetical protein